MSLKKCRECGRDVSTSAKVCPGCGISKPIKKSGFVGAIGFVLLVGLALKLCSGGKAETPVSADVAALRERSDKCGQLTLDAMHLQADVRDGTAHVSDALVRMRMIETDAKQAGCAKLNQDKFEHLASKLPASK